MYEVTGEQWRKVLIHGTILGFTGIFLLVFGGCLLLDVSVATAAGCAIVPAIQGSWFYGGTVYLMAADRAHEVEQKAARAARRAAAPAPARAPERKVSTA